ncbi:FliI/YscN family ATPase [Polynucleobacter sp. AP-Ainpum-60-G11]|uniref:FliI/YscN family ATPase n=1 Tax=Polynucleobacter sp. AP-Ainpum-60-G11 TaxID=2576926 RepID=UPI001BFDE988|nr:FliI/YscN family ATPase [Polynucleobacter sp. AP-Ainpum-60-G11]
MSHLQPAQIADQLEMRRQHLAQTPRSIREGKLKRVSGIVLEVEGLPMSIGTGATILSELGGKTYDAECIGFNGAITYLMPIDTMEGISPGALVYPADTPFNSGSGYTSNSIGEPLPIGESLLGRVVDGLGRPIDGKGYGEKQFSPFIQRTLNPLDRTPIHEPLDVGIQAVNGLLTVGRGQRVGIFAGSGVGKSVLLGMLARNCVADVIVIGLVGERGREVREFCEDTLGPESFKRAVVVAAPADASPLARSKGASYATDVAIWFRDQGKHVVLIVDSLTRYAMALREIGLSLGEAPVARGYPPSVFARMPELVERVGNGANPDGSITAFYTVLLEGDDTNDPVADTARGILDGHFFLSRELADSGHYPAIDVEKSISRVMPKVVSKEHLLSARRLKQLYSRYMRGRDLVSMGAYIAGTDPDLDAALQAWPKIQAFLQQDAEQTIPIDQTEKLLFEIAPPVV